MKSLIAPFLASAAIATCLVCGVAAASLLNTQYEPHKFENLNSALWTSTPVRVDQANQTFERVASAIPASAFTPAVTDRTEPAAPKEPVVAQNAVETVSDQNGQWCHARYQSYRETDNSYQPLTGGPRRQCQPPTAATETSAEVTAAVTPVAETSQTHMDWCSARYSSYRFSDDSYQPFGGGERRRCVSDQGDVRTNG